MNFLSKRNVGKIVETEDSKAKPTQCLPLYSLLLALNQTRVDYFSLDVEGAELKVLKTIPFKKLDIRVITAEYSHTSEGNRALLDYMYAQGYVNIVNVTRLAKDYVFVKKGVKVKPIV